VRTCRDLRGEGYHRLERAYGSFSRSLTLPEGVDPEAVQASFERGVLEVRIPKPEQRKPRRVAISVGGNGGKPAPETIEGGESAS
jgi:HSP20 family protein